MVGELEESRFSKMVQRGQIVTIRHRHYDGVRARVVRIENYGGQVTVETLDMGRRLKFSDAQLVDPRPG